MSTSAQRTGANGTPSLRQAQCTACLREAHPVGVYARSAYTTIEGKIESLTGQRDELAMKMRAWLENAAFNGQTINSNKARAFIKQGQTLLNKMYALATSL